MPYAKNDGVALSYDVVGPADRDDSADVDESATDDGSGADSGTGDVDAVTFVEGLSFGRWMWRWQREALADEFTTVVWDNRGTGDSDEPDGPYTVAEMASDLEAVLDDAGVERTHLVGASLGGMIAQRYALEYDRAESLALLCTTPGGDDAVPIPEATRDRMLNVPAEYGPAESIRYRMKPAFTDEFWTENPDVVDRIVDWRLETDPSERAYEWQSAAGASFDASDRLDEISVPTLVLHGTADRVVPVENGRLLAAGIPDAELVTDEGGPHLFFLEDVERVNDELRRFLSHV